MKLAGYKWILALIDYTILNFCFALAMRIRFKPDIDIINLSEGIIIKEIIIFAFVSFLAVYSFETNQMYKYQTFTNRKIHLVKLFKSIFIDILLIVVFFSFFFKLGSRYESRLFIIYFLIISFVIFFVYRVLLFKSFFLWFQKIGYLQRKLIIYGAGNRGNQVREKVEKSNQWKFIGFIDDNKEKNEKNDIFGDYNTLINLRKLRQVDTVIIAINTISHKRLQEIINSLKILDVRIFLVSGLYEILYQTQTLESVDDLTLIELNYNSKSFYLNFIKKITDLVLASVGIVILLPLFIIISIFIKITSKGPVFFKQQRIGKNGKFFAFYKFRSMYINKDNKTHKTFTKEFINGKIENGTTKITKDSRITPIGYFIRKTSIDELPQLFNVIKGNMSMVGPRPCLPYEYKEYKEWHKSRFMIKPGLTGVWQVSGRSTVSFDEMVIMDYYYIHNMSPWLDFKLIIKTIPVVILGKGGF
ncbi:MAG: sugar transferase [Bacteroidales bacterium]|nr:sugar transferase [Bacteroidales bacterium]